jgi:uncharacterized membrane protein YhdT
MASRLEQAIEQGSGSEIKQAGIDYLREHRNWYGRYSRIYMWIWNGFTISIIIIGAVAAILAAIRKGVATPNIWIEWALIILPAVSALLASVLAQFRTRDLWQLREMGRIASEELVARAYAIDAADAKSAAKDIVGLRLLAHQIERDQTIGFFGEPMKPTG